MALFPGSQSRKPIVVGLVGGGDEGRALLEPILGRHHAQDSGDRLDRRAGLSEGARVLSKPFSPEALVQRIRELCD